jgi:hypothetical protein
MTKSEPDSEKPGVLDIYKLFVEMTDRMSARRAGTNTFFVTLHAGLAAVVGIIGAVKPRGAGTVDHLTFGTLAVVGFTLSFTWWALLRYYRRLSGAKFDVINRIETFLPIQPYTDEWKVLHPDEAPGEDATAGERIKYWFRHKRHREASLVEQLVPLVFAVIYIVLGVKVLTA